MPAFDYAAFLTTLAPPAPGQLYGGGDNITAVGRGVSVKAYPGATNSSSDSPAVIYTADGVPGARAFQVLMWLGGEATGTGMTVVIEEQLSTLPTVAPTYPPTAPAASGIYRPLGIANFGDSPGSSGSWNVSGSWTADPLATGTVAGATVAGITGVGTGASGSNGRMYTDVIIQVDPNVYSINYNVIRYTGGGHFDNFNCVLVPFEGAGKPYGSPN